jgi:hypothetical protein
VSVLPNHVSPRARDARKAAPLIGGFIGAQSRSGITISFSPRLMAFRMNRVSDGRRFGGMGELMRAMVHADIVAS